MSSLNTALVEVHMELEKHTRAAKDMVEACKNEEKATDLWHTH